jgi:TldD protein
MNATWMSCIAPAAALLFAFAAGAEPATAPVSGGIDGETQGVLADALQEEIQRSMEGLALPGAPPLYHLRYHLMLFDSANMEASYGALSRHDVDVQRRLGVEVRVGEPAFDNSGFGGWETGFDSGRLPAEPTPTAVRQAAWRLTDGAYKDAVEQHARKSASWSPPPDHPGDFELRGAASGEAPLPAPVDPERLAAIAREVSAAFPADQPLEVARVYAIHGGGAAWTLDSEGTRVTHGYAETAVRAAVHVRTDDGLLLTDHRTWIVRHTDQLPPTETMRQEVVELSQEMVALAGAPALESEYVGPVLFEDTAAADLFRYLLVDQLEGTPAVIPFDSVFGKMGQNFGAASGANGNVRVGRRTLPPGWTVVDDPRRDPDHPASFPFDLEGTPAEEVTLVTDGIVRTLLMSRVPRRGEAGSNGHARGNPGDRLEGRASMLEVTAPKRLGEAGLRRQALKLARAYGLDHVLVIRRFEEDAVRTISGGMFSFLMRGDDETGQLQLPRPLQLVRLYADGHEEPVRGAVFAGVHRWVLRDIAAAGPQVGLTYYAPFEKGDTLITPTAGMPTYISAPAVLIGEMELVPMPGDPMERTVVPPPTP